ncbi:MAG: phosphotriesterase family protein [Bacillota bacterium]
MEKIIRTVLGDISPEQLGFCDSHAHLMVISEHLKQMDVMFDVQDYENTLKEMKPFKEAGGRTFVDCHPIGIGRATVELPRLAKETGLNIIASTGFHIQPYYIEDHWTFSATEEELTSIYINEIEKGMYINTEEKYPDEQITAKAGSIKTASNDAEFDELDKKRIKAAVNASLQTGVTLHNHTSHEFKNAIMYTKTLIGMGISPESIIMAHTDSSHNAMREEDYHFRIADMGVFLDFDCFVNPSTKVGMQNTEEFEINIIKKMIDHGYVNQLTLGSDPVLHALLIDGGPGLGYLPGRFMEKLLASGVTKEQITTMMVTNPAKAYTIKKK